MITYDDVFETMGRIYFIRALQEKVVIVGRNNNERAKSALIKGHEMAYKLYRRKTKLIEIATKKPCEAAYKFKDLSVRFLFLDYPKDLVFFNSMLKCWGEKICLNGVMILRGNYEDGELEDHPIDERYEGSLHGIYRIEPPLTMLYKKWGMPYVK